jgi:GT2 family glycosyltransferase
MTQTPTLISFVILNYNGKELAERCIDSLTCCISGYNYEIIVVDNGSSDGSVEYLKNKFPSIKIIEEGYNKFIVAYNDGVEKAKGEWVFLLNNDMVFKEDFLTPLLDCISDKDSFAVGSKMLSFEGKFEKGANIAKFRFGYLWLKTKEVDKLTPSIYIGAHGLFRKEMFLELGGFDEIYLPFYSEDLDLCYRAWKRGWKVFVEPRSVIYHKHMATINKFFDRNYILRVNARNHFIFLWKNLSSKRLIIRHILFLPLLLIGAVLISKSYYLSGFVDALQLLLRGEIKRLTQNNINLKDEEIFKLFRDYW